MDETNPKRKRDEVSSTSSLDISQDISINKEKEAAGKHLTKSQRSKQTKVEQKNLDILG